MDVTEEEEEEEESLAMAYVPAARLDDVAADIRSGCAADSRRHRRVSYNNNNGGEVVETVGEGNKAAVPLNVTGAGDTLVAATLWRLHQEAGGLRPSSSSSSSFSTTSLSSSSSSSSSSSPPPSFSSLCDAVRVGVVAAAVSVLDPSAAVPPLLSSPGVRAAVLRRAAALPAATL